MQDEPAEEVAFPPLTLHYIDRISKSVLETMLPDGFGLLSSAIVCFVNAVQFGYFIYYDASGRIQDRWGIKQALSA